jgi:hypothetical protein
MTTDVLNLWFCGGFADVLDGFGGPAPSDNANPSGCNAG